MTSVVLLGHSHLLRLRSAIGTRVLPEAAEAQAGLRLLFHDVWKNRPDYADSGLNGGVVFNAAILDDVRAATAGCADVAYVTSFGGNGHVVFGLTRHARPFDVVVPDQPDLPLDPAAEVIPYRYLDAAMHAQMSAYIWQMIALRRAVPNTVICLESPPPYADDDYVRTHLGSYIPDPDNVVPAVLRLKLWLTHSHQIRAHCLAHGIEFLPVPRQTLDPPGFMARAGYGPDATHGNDWFGEQVLQQVETRFGKPIVSYAEFA